AGLTWQELEVIKGQQEDIQKSVNTGISAVEALKSRIESISDASNILHLASQDAYDELVEQGFLEATDLLRNDLSDLILNKYRMAFNKHLTKYIGSSEYREQVDDYTRGLLNEHRLGKDWAEGADAWAKMNVDFPYKSKLFEGIPLNKLKESL